MYSDNREKIMLSIVTPIYKDSYLAKDFIEEVFSLKLPKEIDLIEVLFVIDGSGEVDEENIKTVASKHAQIKMISLSRNFGQHIAVSAGYAYVIGDLICMMNVDQQDPPKEMLKLLPYIMSGKYDVVYGLRQKRRDNYLKQISSYLFNILLNKLTGQNIPLNVATMRIMSRRFINSYNKLSEKSRYLPGLENWLGFSKIYIPINHQARKDGKSSYNLNRRLLMAMESIISFSDLPLRWISILGFILAITGFISLITLLVAKIFFVDYQPGYASIVAIIVFLSGVQIVLIGFSSLYVGRILQEVQNRPLFIVKETKNI
ncbi:glycosyltransferase family 2 protein [Candidatus Synechococcus calcipolaris G9]|uniref:Glycosyltransferase family 2 protein n=1 Tax=Candidatus Synechococcus calcipolaris G9 TaxID=1497997 RepID=A0ABT6F3H5_9SYNE|nr:glycosyltransferase family 2 protein [Candidatus Synechococcus calcipolaris]MDG2992415.1 glycosyltransferase family 2 protein [Candidatus Synechococcus calcipolaris G9]